MRHKRNSNFIAISEQNLMAGKENSLPIQRQPRGNWPSAWSPVYFWKSESSEEKESNGHFP